MLCNAKNGFSKNEKKLYYTYHNKPKMHENMIFYLHTTPKYDL